MLVGGGFVVDWGGCCWPAGDLSPALYRPCRSLQMFFSASSGASSSVSGLYSSGRNLVVGQCVIVSHRHFLCRRPAGTLSSGRQGFDFGQKPDAIFLEYVIFCVGRLTRVLFFSFLLLGVNNTFITNIIMAAGERALFYIVEIQATAGRQ